MATQAALTINGQPLYDPLRTVPLSFSYYKTWLITFLENENQKGNRQNPKIGLAIGILNVMQNFKNAIAYDEKTKVSDLTMPQSSKVFSISDMIKILNEGEGYDLEQLSVRLFHAVFSNIREESKPVLMCHTPNIVLTQNFSLFLECFGNFIYAPNKAQNLKPILSFKGVNFLPEPDPTDTKLRFNINQVYDKLALSKDRFTLHDAKLSVPFLTGSPLLPKKISSFEFDLLVRAFPTRPGILTLHVVKEVLKDTKTIDYISGKIAYDGRNYEPTDVMREERLFIQAEENCTITSDPVTFDILSKTGKAELQVEKVEQKRVHILVRLNTKPTDQTTDDRGVVEFKVNFTLNNPIYGPGTEPNNLEIGWNDKKTVTFKVARVVFKSIFDGKETTFDPNDPTTFNEQPAYLNVRHDGDHWHFKTPYPAPPIVDN